ncbi:hypothetical protein Emed_001839 [Eimeria media]
MREGLISTAATATAAAFQKQRKQQQQLVLQRLITQKNLAGLGCRQKLIFAWFIPDSPDALDVIVPLILLTSEDLV